MSKKSLLVGSVTGALAIAVALCVPQANAFVRESSNHSSRYNSRVPVAASAPSSPSLTVSAGPSELSANVTATAANPAQIVQSAATYATSRGWQTGIAVVDTVSGATYTAGNANSYFPSESTVKVVFAGNILASGQMSSVDGTARSMITRSDDNAANTLFSLAGGDGAVARAGQRYGIALGAGPYNPGWWGGNRVTPVGMAQYLSAVKKDTKVGPWLYSAMSQTQALASDGTNQNFGIRAVAPSAPVKQGWGRDVPGGNAVVTPSIGYVNNGRYAVAIYTMKSEKLPYASGFEIVSQQAKILMPNGSIPF